MLEEVDTVTDVLEPRTAGCAPAQAAVLAVSFCEKGSQYVLSASGDLVGSSISALEAYIDQIGYCSESKDLVLDLTELVSLDATGLSVLVGIAEYVRALGRRMEIMGATGPVATALVGANLVPIGDSEGHGSRQVLKPDLAGARYEREKKATVTWLKP